MNTSKKQRLLTTLSLAAVLVGSVYLSTGLGNANTAFAATDKNGMQLKEPTTGYSLTFGKNWYNDSTSSPEYDLNIIDHGSGLSDSVRVRFMHSHNTTSEMIGGYFKLSPGACSNTPNEDIGAALNGGWHSDTAASTPTSTTPVPNENYADTMWLDITDYDGTESRFRVEPDHPHYSNAIAPTSTSSAFPTATDLCSTPDGWVGVQAYKLNKDANCNGIPERIIIVGYLDLSGLNPSTGKPQNNWVRTFYGDYVISTLTNLGIKSADNPWVRDIGQSSYQDTFIRLDNQSGEDWSDGNNIKFFTLKQVTFKKDTCP